MTYAPRDPFDVARRRASAVGALHRGLSRPPWVRGECPPQSDSSHTPYSKRVMAFELGPRWTICKTPTIMRKAARSRVPFSCCGGKSMR